MHAPWRACASSDVSADSFAATHPIDGGCRLVVCLRRRPSAFILSFLLPSALVTLSTIASLITDVNDLIARLNDEADQAATAGAGGHVDADDVVFSYTRLQVSDVGENEDVDVNMGEDADYWRLLGGFVCLVVVAILLG